jgi:hypothetical protein
MPLGPNVETFGNFLFVGLFVPVQSQARERDGSRMKENIENMGKY